MGVLSPGYKTLSVLDGGAAQCCSFCTAEGDACASWSFVVASGACSLYANEAPAVPAPGRIYGRTGNLTRRGWTTMPQWLTQVRCAVWWVSQSTSLRPLVTSMAGARPPLARSSTPRKEGTGLHPGTARAPACRRFRCVPARDGKNLLTTATGTSEPTCFQDPVSWTQGINGSMAAVNGIAPMRNCP